MTGSAVAACLAPREDAASGPRLTAGLVTAVALHGLLDYVPHHYPIKSAVDVVMAVLLFAAAFVFSRPRARLLLLVCFLGSVLPDLIDLAPAILDRHAGFHLPSEKYFPWHWKPDSGSVYDGSRQIESLIAHLLALTISLGLIWRQRVRMFRT